MENLGKFNNQLFSMLRGKFIIHQVIASIFHFNVAHFYIVSAGNPLTAPIISGQECEIEIDKGDVGLGLSIVGGSDTVLVNSLVSKHIHIFLTCFFKLNDVNCGD